MFRVLVNSAKEYAIASAGDAERLCVLLGELPAFTAHATGPAGPSGPTLDVVVESGRALVSFLDIERDVKMASRNTDCAARDIVSLRNDSYPELQLEQIEAERREFIAPSRALAMLRHFLTTAEAIDLVHWPPTDGEDIPAARAEPIARPDEDIPF